MKEAYSVCCVPDLNTPNQLYSFFSSKPRPSILSKEHIVTVMFVGNFIGIVCARSLHYQFYSWYFYSLPFLLWKTHFPTPLRIIIFLGVELCWNIYPSTAYSSLLLLFLHISVLLGIWFSPTEYPYIDKRTWQIYQEVTGQYEASL